jgi:hypothetical protein
VINKVKSDLTLEFRKMEGSTKANFLPFLHKEKVEFGCRTKAVLYIFIKASG